MIQARVIKPHDIEFFEVPAPEAKDLKDNEILLRIHKIGVCGSDIHVMHGQHPFVTYPVIQGHEYGAEVVAVGKDVTAVRPGVRSLFAANAVPAATGVPMYARTSECRDFRLPGAPSHIS